MNKGRQDRTRWKPGWRIWLAALSLLWIAPGLSAQTPEDRARFGMSLEDCVRFALDNHGQVKNARFDEYISQRQVKQFTGIGLPQLNGKVEFNDMEIVPTTVVPANSFDPTAPADTYLELQFGIRFQMTASVTLSQMIFDGSFFVGLEASRKVNELTALSTERTRRETAANVATAYYTVLMAERRLQLLDVNIDRLDSLKRVTEALFNEGFAEQLDVSRIEVAAANLRMQKQSAGRSVNLSRALLKFQMGMDLDSEIILSDTISDPEYYRALPAPRRDAGLAFEQSVELELLNTQEELTALDMKRYQVGRLPSAYAFATFSRQAFRNKFDFFNFDNPWYSSAIIGVSINVPIFDGLRTHHTIQEKRLELQKLETNRTMLEQSIALQVEQADVNLRNAESTLEQYRRNYELAKEVYRISSIKQVEGVGSNLDLIEAESSMRESETSYLSALYEYMLARIEVQKAMGTLLDDLQIEDEPVE